MYKHFKKSNDVLALLLLAILLLSGFNIANIWAEDSTSENSQQKGNESFHKESLDFWHSLSPEEKQAVREKHRRFRNLPPEERQRIREKLAEFQKLSPEQREKIKTNVDRFRELPPEERQRIREKLAEFQKLSPEQREKIKTNFRRFKNMSPQQREKLQHRLQRWQNLSDEQKRQLRSWHRKFQQPKTEESRQRIGREKHGEKQPWADRAHIKERWLGEGAQESVNNRFSDREVWGNLTNESRGFGESTSTRDEGKGRGFGSTHKEY